MSVVRHAIVVCARVCVRWRRRTSADTPPAHFGFRLAPGNLRSPRKAPTKHLNPDKACQGSTGAPGVDAYKRYTVPYFQLVPSAFKSRSHGDRGPAPTRCWGMPSRSSPTDSSPHHARGCVPGEYRAASGAGPVPPRSLRSFAAGSRNAAGAGRGNRRAPGDTHLWRARRAQQPPGDELRARGVQPGDRVACSCLTASHS